MTLLISAHVFIDWQPYGVLWNFTISARKITVLVIARDAIEKIDPVHVIHDHNLKVSIDLKTLQRNYRPLIFHHYALKDL